MIGIECLAHTTLAAKSAAEPKSTNAQSAELKTSECLTSQLTAANAKVDQAAALACSRDGSAKNRRPQRGEQLRLDLRSGDVKRLVKIHLVRNRPARDQRQADILPILVAGVLDDGPALKKRLALLVQHEPIARFPDRVLHDVADPHAAFAVALEAETDHFLFRVVRGGQHFQSALELAVKGGIEKANTLNLGEQDTLHAVRRQQIQHIHLGLGGVFAAHFHAHDGACQCRRQRAGIRAHGHFDFLAAGLVQDLAERRVIGQIQGKALERLVDRVGTIVGNRADAPAIAILEHQALEQIVDISAWEGEIDPAAAGDLSFTLVIADAAAEKNHLANRQQRRRRPQGLAAGLGCRLRRSGTSSPDQTHCQRTQDQKDEKLPRHQGIPPTWSSNQVTQSDA